MFKSDDICTQVMQSKEPLLEIKNLHAGIDGNVILNGIDIEIGPGEIHAIMGRNGSGKTTTANIVMGHPDFDVEDGEIKLMGNDLLDLEPWERAKEGVFLSFQYPQAVPGLQVGNFLKKSVASIKGDEAAKGKNFRELLKKSMKELNMPSSFLSRYVNDGFSGGEKKRFEILQMMLLQPKLAILDETDSGLDVDAMKLVASGVNELKSSSRSFVIITHYQRLLNHIIPDFVHIMSDGKIIKSGGKELALEIEKNGYSKLNLTS